MTDKAKERIQRACKHLTLLRVGDINTGEWVDKWMCADCDEVFMDHQAAGSIEAIAP